MRKKLRLTATQILALGFLLIILIGALLLMLPVSNRDRQWLPFLDAVFTTTSATCVTGLIVHDTWTQFSHFGQAVILLLIQIGGLGFMTFGVLFSLALKRKIGLKTRTFISESVSAFQMGGVVKLVRHILFGTLIFEGAGVLLLMTRFCPDFGIGKGIWYSVFHAVSAFCNAGFDLMGVIEPYSSLTSYAADPVVNITIMLLIIIGGIGFVIWSDIKENGLHIRKYGLHTKLILTTDLLLLVAGAAIMMAVEWSGTMAGMSFGERVLASFFQVVTPRTAGFNTVDTATLSSGGMLITMIYMFIGASPGSTGGGVKVSTMAAVILALVAYMRGREDVNVFGRRLENSVVHRAFYCVIFNLSLVLVGSMIVFIAQPLPFTDILFEALSALGTVGMSTGITRELGAVARIVMILLMYAGRVGSLALIISGGENKKTGVLKSPEEKIIIG